jgi:cold shock CspA family protein
MTKVSGRVAWFSNRKGYGFVCSPQVAEQNEIFVHHTSIVSPDGMYRTLVREFEEVRCTRVRPGCCSETIYRLLACESSVAKQAFFTRISQHPIALSSNTGRWNRCRVSRLKRVRSTRALSRVAPHLATGLMSFRMMEMVS